MDCKTTQNEEQRRSPQTLVRLLILVWSLFIRNIQLSTLFHKPQVCSAERKEHAAHIAARSETATNSDAKSRKIKEG